MSQFVGLNKQRLREVAEAHTELLEEHKHENSVRCKPNPCRNKALEETARASSRCVEDTVGKTFELTGLKMDESHKSTESDALTFAFMSRVLSTSIGCVSTVAPEAATKEENK